MRRPRHPERGVFLLLVAGLLALLSSTLSSYFLPHILAWRRNTRCLPTGDLFCPQEMSHPYLDVVSIAVKQGLTQCSLALQSFCPCPHCILNNSE
jgi:hypothetical protein